MRRSLTALLLLGWIHCAYGAERIHLSFGDVAVQHQSRDVRIPISITAPPAIAARHSGNGQESLFVPQIAGAQLDVPDGMPVLPYVVLRLVVPFPAGADHKDFQVQDWVQIRLVSKSAVWDYVSGLVWPTDGLSILPQTLARYSTSAALIPGALLSKTRLDAVYGRYSGTGMTPPPEVRGAPFYDDLELTLVLWLGRIVPVRSGHEAGTAVQTLRQGDFEVILQGVPVYLQAGSGSATVETHGNLQDSVRNQFPSCGISMDLVGDLQNRVTSFKPDVRLYDLRGSELRPEAVRLLARDLQQGSGIEDRLSLRYEVVLPSVNASPLTGQFIIRDGKARIVRFQPFAIH